MANRPVVGRIVSMEEAVNRLPRREVDVWRAIFAGALRDDPGQFTPYEVDVFALSKALGMKHDQVSDAVESIANRRFQVRMGDRKVFSYPLFSILARHHRHMDKPMESVLIAFPHATNQDETADESWQHGEIDPEIVDAVEAGLAERRPE